MWLQMNGMPFHHFHQIERRQDSVNQLIQRIVKIYPHFTRPWKIHESDNAGICKGLSGKESNGCVVCWPGDASAFQTACEAFRRGRKYQCIFVEGTVSSFSISASSIWSSSNSARTISRPSPVQDGWTLSLGKNSCDDRNGIRRVFFCAGLI